jgi:hypothetical protein
MSRRSPVTKTEILAARFSYKPGWTFTAIPGKDFGLDWIEILSPPLKDADEKVAAAPALAADGVRLGWTVAIHWDFPVPEEFQIRMVWEAIQQIECHEASEWFKVDGDARFNEHKTRPERFRG